jgi:Amino acid synthesis
MDIRKILDFGQEVHIEGGRKLKLPTRAVAAAAVVKNPAAGKPALDDHTELVDLSVQLGDLLTKRCLDRLGDPRPRAYGKAVVVGTAGDLEHGAAMIHVRIGLSMRRGIGRGLALIPGNGKVGGPGTPIDLVFGGVDNGWDYDAMDTLPIIVADAPRPDEILLIVGFATGRPNARIAGASEKQVADLVRILGK